MKKAGEQQGMLRGEKSAVKMKSRFYSNERMQLVLSVFLPLLVFVVVQCVLPIRYETNDDATLANIAAGAYGPDTLHMVYVNVLFAALLRPLYWLYGDANWYVILQLALMLVACAALFRIALRRLGTMHGCLLSMAVMITFSTQLFYRFQYVKVSCVLLTTGLLLIADALGQFNRQTVLGLALAVLGAWIRWDNFYAIGGLSAAMLLGSFARLERPQRKRAAATMLLLFALVLISRGIDVAAYTMQDGWDVFWEYNAARMEFSDYKARFLIENENPLWQHGVAYEEYMMLLNWDYYDSANFSARRLWALAEAVPGKSPVMAVKHTLGLLLTFLPGLQHRWLMVLELRRTSLPFLATLAILVGELVYLQYRDRFPLRVEVGVLFGAVLFGLYCVGLGEKRRCADVMLGLAAAVLVAAWPSGFRVDVADRSDYDKLDLSNTMTAYTAMSEDKDHLYLLTTPHIELLEGYDVWNPRPKDFYSNIVVVGGWLSQAPHRQAVLAAYGVADSALVQAVDNPAVIVGRHNLSCVLKYVQYRLGKEVDVLKVGDNYLAYSRLVTVTPGQTEGQGA